MQFRQIKDQVGRDRCLETTDFKVKLEVFNFSFNLYNPFCKMEQLTSILIALHPKLLQSIERIPNLLI